MEKTLMMKPASEGDLHHGKIRFQEHLFGLEHSQFTLFLLERDPHDLFEEPSKMADAASAMAGELLTIEADQVGVGEFLNQDSKASDGR